MATSGYQRSIYFVDAENMVGSPSPFQSEIRPAWAEVRRVTGYRNGDLVIVGSSSVGTLCEVYEAIPNARHLVRCSRDGADLELIAALNCELEHCWKSNARGDRLVVVSGDGAFADPLARAASAGRLTHVVSRADRLSKQLRLAAHDYSLIDPGQFSASSARVIWSSTGRPRLLAA